MSSVWAQTYNGRAIDMIDPDAAQVDLREIADTLAHANRYAGNSPKPVSIAQHTIIAFDAAADAIKPWVLLHKAKEAYIGDITAPMQDALAHLANQTIRDGGMIFRASLALLERRHASAIHDAAGLPMPTHAQNIAIRRADIIALQTERRDFLNPCAKAWAPDIEAERPLRKVYRLRAAGDVADNLYALFRAWLPVFAGANRSFPK